MMQRIMAMGDDKAESSHSHVLAQARFIAMILMQWFLTPVRLFALSCCECCDLLELAGVRNLELTELLDQAVACLFALPSASWSDS